MADSEQNLIYWSRMHMHILGFKSPGTERFQKAWTRILTTWLTGDLRWRWASNKIPVWANEALVNPQRNKETQFPPPPRHWRNSRLCILTRRTSKLLPSKVPIRRGWLISQVQTTTKSHWLNTRAFLAHAKLLVDPTILQDPCPPRGGSAFQLLRPWPPWWLL